MTRSVLLVVVVTATAACAARSPYDRTQVSKELAAHSGHGLRTEPTPDETIPPGVDLQDGLDEDEAVAVALWNNAAFQADLASLGVARAELLDAGMIRNPALTLFLPRGPRQLEFTATLPIEGLWTRPRRVKAAKLDVARVATGLVQNGLDLIRDVKAAHADVVLGQTRERLARESARLRGEIAAIARARLDAGDISLIEHEAVRIDAEQARADLIRQSHQAEAALDTLRALLGWSGAQPAFSVRASAVAPRALADLSQAEKDALALRPDVRAAELAVEAAGARLGWEETRIVSNFAAAAKGSGVGPEFVVGPGFALEIPLFNQNQGPRARAHAEIERAIWQYAATRQRVLREVREAYRQYREAEEMLELLRSSILSALDENVRRAGKAFAEGGVSYLFVLDTTRQRLDAGLREAEMEANLRRGRAQLDRSIGRKLADQN
jgi:cobalt-zinc-cadmium efflux system outer membrane protein